MSRRLALVLLTLTACELEETGPGSSDLTGEEFVEQYSEAWCYRTEECYPDQYASHDACLADYAAVWDGFEDDSSGCTLISWQAEECLDAIYDSSCGQLFEQGVADDDCRDLWSCS